MIADCNTRSNRFYQYISINGYDISWLWQADMANCKSESSYSFPWDLCTSRNAVRVFQNSFLRASIEFFYWNKELDNTGLFVFAVATDTPVKDFWWHPYCLSKSMTGEPMFCHRHVMNSLNPSQTATLSNLVAAGAFTHIFFQAAVGV